MDVVVVVFVADVIFLVFHILILNVLTFFFYTQSLTNLTRCLVMQLNDCNVYFH